MTDKRLLECLQNSEAIVIGAGAGLSTSAGFIYTGERFHKYFYDFKEKYSFQDMYIGGFYPYETKEEYWAYWSRYIYINRYMNPPKAVYDKLFELLKDKNYFVITTNVDHCFQKAGFDKKRLFYTQGDYGLFQCSKPCHQKTYDNENIISEMIKDQGFVIDKEENLQIPKDKSLKMTIPTELIPHCQKCGEPMTMNLRADNTFVEDKGWHKASNRYTKFLEENINKKILFLELGVGYNTPGIIKYPFWQMTYANPKAKYFSINKGEVSVPKEIESQAICIDEDIAEIILDI